MSTLTLKFKDKVLNKFLVNKENILAIGRQTSNDVVIVNLAVSGYHAEIIPSNNGFLLKDLNSKNGTLLNGQRITSSILLENNDKIIIGKHILIFEEEDVQHDNDEIQETSILFENPYEMADKTVIIDTNQLSKIQSAKKKDLKIKAYIKLLDSGREIPLNKQVTTIGKNFDSDIVIKGLFKFLAGDTSATISKRPDGYYISSMGGILKPKVNNKVLKKAMKLKSLDSIRISSFTMIFVAAPLDENK